MARRLLGAKIFVVFVFSSAAICTNAHAASWTIGSAQGHPGDEVLLSLVFNGDGLASAAEVTFAIDQSRFTIDEPEGSIPAASLAGSCAWNGSNELVGLLLSTSATPYAVGPVTVCEFPIRIRSVAPIGTIPVHASSATCAPTVTKNQTCPVTSGSIEIQGVADDELVAPLEPQSKGLIVLLAAGSTTVDQVVGADRVESPLEAIQQFQPHTIRPLIATRAVASLDEFQSSPNSTAARLQRYLVLEFSSTQDRSDAMSMLTEDPLVESVSVDKFFEFAGNGSSNSGPAALKAIASTDHRYVMGIDELWGWSTGWGLVGIVDNGITTDHPDLRTFSGADSVGGTWIPAGNYLPYFSKNVGGFGQSPTALGELVPSYPEPGETSCGPGPLYPPTAGHGTHVSGLVAAAADNAGVTGFCKHCGVGMMKATYVKCEGSIAYTSIPESNSTAAVVEAVSQGAQVISMSFTVNGPANCSDYPDLCEALDLAAQSDVVVVAAAGNNLFRTGFPARRDDVVSVGGIFGIDESGNPRHWTLSPNCPPLPPTLYGNSECGSNYRVGSPTQTGWDFIQYVAPASGIMSSVVPDEEWNVAIACGDGFDNDSDDGFGPCTGTSMSTPQVSAIFGVLRSINPMLSAGSTWTPGVGVKGVVRQTSSRQVAGLVNHYQLGYGLPRPAAAAKLILGTVRAGTAVNRATPLFHLYSPGRDDYAAVATPHLAMALSALEQNPYFSVSAGSGGTFVEGDVIKGYPSFPGPSGGPPRAMALVMTTDRVRSGLPQPVPLYLMAWPRPAAGNGDDYVLASGSMVQTVANAGYAFAGRQGYIFPWCATPNCSPAGTEALHLKCKNPNNSLTRRCVVFPESRRTDFEPEYMSYFPGAPTTPLGYAFSATLDQDTDDLLDGAEIVIGTSTGSPNSDGDLSLDVVEYPFAGLPVSDPCAGPNIQCPGIVGLIFRSGFE